MVSNAVMTIDELAGYLKIPKSTLYKLAQKGAIPSLKGGRHWRFHKATVDRWLEEAPRPHPRRDKESDRLRRDPILAEVVRRLTEAYQPDRIYLFGSKAPADAGPHSHHHLLLLVPRQ